MADIDVVEDTLTNMTDEEVALPDSSIPTSRRIPLTATLVRAVVQRFQNGEPLTYIARNVQDASGNQLTREQVKLIYQRLRARIANIRR